MDNFTDHHKIYTVYHFESKHLQYCLLLLMNMDTLHKSLHVNYVTLHEHLSQDKSLFYAHVTSETVWQLTLCKISPSQDSYFGHMVLANNVGVNLGLDSSPTLARGFPIHFHIPHQALRFPTPSDNGKHGLLG